MGYNPLSFSRILRYHKIKFTDVSIVLFEGRGVHTGHPVRLMLHFDPTIQGIAFRRTDLDNIIIPARWDTVCNTNMRTEIGLTPEARVSTIEHFLSALRACHIYHVLIDIDGPELPIFDGSALYFYDNLKTCQPQAISTFKVLETIEVTHETGWARLSPAPTSCYDVLLDGGNRSSQVFSHQSCTFDFAQDDYGSLIAPARTFGFLDDAEKLKTMGLAQNASLENTLVIDGDTFVNEPRMANELAAHKVLDAIGDLSLVGHPIEGFFEARNPGHALNHQLVCALMTREGAYKRL